MRIRMKTRIAGPDVSGGPGDILEIEDARARDLITGGFADPIEEAVVSAPELAVGGRSRRRRTAG
jgi:hypothetical protein